MKCLIPDCEEEMYHTVYICKSKHQVYDLIKEFLAAQSSSEVFRLLAEQRKEKLEKMEKKLKAILGGAFDAYGNPLSEEDYE